MKYYHLSVDMEITTEFQPRIPDENYMIESEDRNTPRICIGKTIEGCFSAVRWGGARVEDLFIDGEASRLIRVYEFDSDSIEAGNLIESDELYKSDKVRDAQYTGECWVINQNLKPTSTYLIELLEFDEYCEDDVSYEDMQNLQDEDDYGDIINGTYFLVKDIKYRRVRGEYNKSIDFSLEAPNNSGVTVETMRLSVVSTLEDYWGIDSLEVINLGNIFRIEGSVSFANNPTTEDTFLKILNNIVDWECNRACA